MPDIYVDADACPVKDEILRVADRHGLAVYIVSDRWLRGDPHPRVHRIVVEQGADVADKWIAEHIGAGDIAITADILLAARCLEKQARVLAPNGKPFTEGSIGMAVAMRDLNAHLRDTGAIGGGPPPFAKQDRSRFLSALEDTIRAVQRGR